MKKDKFLYQSSCYILLIQYNYKSDKLFGNRLVVIP